MSVLVRRCLFAWNRVVRFSGIVERVAPSIYPTSSEMWKNAKLNPVLGDYVPLRECLYADKWMDYFLLPTHKETVPYNLIMEKKWKEAEEILMKKDGADPSVVLALAKVLKEQNRIEEAQQVLLNYTNSHSDSIGLLFCWAALRSLGVTPQPSVVNDASESLFTKEHPIPHRDDVLGIVLETATKDGTDSLFVYKDRRAYRFFSGGRCGFVEFITKYPFYADMDTLKAKREEDKAVYGDMDVMINSDFRFLFYSPHAASSVVANAPVDAASISSWGRLDASEAVEWFDKSASTVKPREKTEIVDKSTIQDNPPVRLSFLTPGGKRVMETTANDFNKTTGSLKNVQVTLNKVEVYLKLLKAMWLNRENTYPLERNLSLYSLNSKGFRRDSQPEEPLNFPPAITSKVRAFADFKKAEIKARVMMKGGDIPKTF